MAISKKQEEKYQDLADCIRSDQLSAEQVVKEFEDKKFKAWYKKRYWSENQYEVKMFKGLHQLARENPNKTYKELEKMKDEQ